MSIVDLTSGAHEWLQASVGGTEEKVRMYPLHVDLHRGTRTLLIDYPDGFERPGVGHQPAGEELVVLTGAFTMSGVTAEPGSVLVVAPHARRQATATSGLTRVVAFFSGPGGGWAEGAESAGEDPQVLPVCAGVVRGDHDGFVGHLEWVAEVPEDGFGADAEIVWTDAGRYAFVPRGGLPPQVDGAALVRFLP